MVLVQLWVAFEGAERADALGRFAVQLTAYLNQRPEKEKKLMVKLERQKCLCQHKKRAPKNNEINSCVKRPLREQRKVFGARIKIM